MTPPAVGIDLSSVGTQILATFNGNLTTISLIAGTMIGAAVVFRWIKRAAK